MDDGYAIGPASAVFDAVLRFSERVEAAVDLVVQHNKTYCFSREHDLEHCEHRLRTGVPIGTLELHDQFGGEPRTVTGILVSGVPFVRDTDDAPYTLDGKAATLESYFRDTTAELHDDPHYLWPVLQFCLTPTLDYWLQHDLPRSTARAAASQDAAILRTAEAALGCVEDICTEPDVRMQRMIRRLRLPGRNRGGGSLRSRVDLAPIAFSASLVGAAECFLDRQSPDGSIIPGFFPTLSGVFGEGAFDVGGHRFRQFIEGGSETAAAFADSWTALRERAGPAADADAEIRGPGPLRFEAADAGRDGGRHLQRRITRQLEDLDSRQFDLEMRALPTDDEERRSWTQCGQSSTQWVSSYPSTARGLHTSAAQFRVMACTYFELQHPQVAALGALPIPCRHGTRGRDRIATGLGCSSVSRCSQAVTGTPATMRLRE